MLEYTIYLDMLYKTKCWVRYGFRFYYCRNYPIKLSKICVAIFLGWHHTGIFQQSANQILCATNTWKRNQNTMESSPTKSMWGYQEIYCRTYYQNEFGRRASWKRKNVSQQVKYDLGSGKELSAINPSDESISYANKVL